MRREQTDEKTTARPLVDTGGGNAQFQAGACRWLRALLLLSALLVVGCDTSPSGDSEPAASDGAYTVAATLPTDYIRGFDVSAVDYWDRDYASTYNGAAWYDTDGVSKDFFAILAAHGVNTARIRVWVDPSKANTSAIITDSYWPASIDVPDAWKAGDNTTARAVRMAQRAKAAGLSVMLDFHYSDYWTDPGKQVIPRAWQDIKDSDVMAEQLASYTTEVLTALKDADVTPKYVQIGNEIDSGILLHMKYNGKATSASSTVAGTPGSENFKKYLAAGCKAVRDFDSGIKIIMHVTNRKAVDFMKDVNGATTDYDIIGLSYYPWEASHGTLSSLTANIASLKKTYGKPVIVAEISAQFDYEVNKPNAELAQSAAHMVDGTGNIYSDLTTETVNGTVQMQGTVQNQANIFRHVIEESVRVGASGIVAWGGERRGDWKYAFFDWEGKAFDSIDIFNVRGR